MTLSRKGRLAPGGLGYTLGVLVRLRSLCLGALATLGCSHAQLSGAELDRVQRPAYVGRVAEGAGPQARGAGPEQSEAQLVSAMNAAIGKFEVSERLRSQLSVALKDEKPWSNAVPASRVASVLETFLVERVPAVPPDFDRLKSTGADAVVELVVESYGLQPVGSTAQAYVRGYARMFLLGNGSELWRGTFLRTATAQGLSTLDAAGVLENAAPYGDQVRALLDGAALQLAAELTPPDRRAGRQTPANGMSAPTDGPTKTEDEAGKTRAPPPDLTPPAQLPSPTDRIKPKPTQPPPDLTAPGEQPVTPKSP